MDPSALIFVALAVAWAVYLIPKALEHHEAGESTRGISSFSHRLRVLGRRDAVSRRATALVTPGERSASLPAAPSVRRSAAPQAASRAARLRATKRRRNVLALIVAILIATAGAAFEGMVERNWVAVPMLLLVAWLVACRLMVRKEHASSVRRVPRAPSAPMQTASADDTASHAAVADPTDPVDAAEPGAVVDSAVGRWDPVDVPLPTYVSKPAAARRTVRTIDLDGTGVWSSGRNEADSALAREADANRQHDAGSTADRKTGS